MPKPRGPVVGVVIIDDHIMFAESLARLLADDPRIVVLGIAHGGTEGLALTARTGPQVVLVDYRMPGRDGVAIAAEIKRGDPETMVVMLTGAAEDEVLLAAIDAGCSGFLTKDRTAATVATAVLASAAGEALITPEMLARLLPKLDRTYSPIGRHVSRRERQVLGYLANGATTNAISAEMGLSMEAIDSCVASVLAKLDAHSKLEAVATAVREGVIPVSLHDPLTGLLNRSALIKRLTQLLDAEPHRPVLVAACDIDEFRLLNEAMGTNVGDGVLVEVASRLQSAAGRGAIVGRCGNDEFIVIIAGHDGIDPEAVGSKLSAAFPIVAAALTVTVSVGLVVGTAYGDTGERRATAETLVAAARVAVRGARERRRGHWTAVSPHQDPRAMRQFELTNSLRGAVERGEIHAHFQPLVTLADGGLVGFEALARWERDGGVTISPDDFVPIAEQTGVIDDIGLSMLDQACALLGRHQDSARTLKVAVNVSACQLDDPDFGRRVAEVLGNYPIPRLSICLELTETSLVPGGQAMLDRLHALKRLGVTLAIDDFGTGYSSFAYLSEFPIDILKLDRSFVTDLQDDPRRIAVVGSIIALALTLGIDVLAEGIETEAERAILDGLHCRFGQGFLWGRPVPSDEILTGTILPRIG